MSNLDRSGNERCAGYRQEDFRLCPFLHGVALPPRDCPACGGYGEVPFPKMLPAPVPEAGP